MNNDEVPIGPGKKRTQELFFWLSLPGTKVVSSDYPAVTLFNLERIIDHHQTASTNSITKTCSGIETTKLGSVWWIQFVCLRRGKYLTRASMSSIAVTVTNDRYLPIWASTCQSVSLFVHLSVSQSVYPSTWWPSLLLGYNQIQNKYIYIYMNQHPSAYDIVCLFFPERAQVGSNKPPHAQVNLQYCIDDIIDAPRQAPIGSCLKSMSNIIIHQNYSQQSWIIIMRHHH